MPANLPPQYSKLEEEFRRATTPAEKLDKLREMYRVIPKHKGTEKLQAELKQKISRARDEAESGKPGAKKGPSHKVPHEGAGQVVILGPPNSGKSSLLAALTHAKPQIAAYPFTTHAPQPGIMMWEDVPVQLVDLPPVSADVFEPWVASLARSADAAILLADLADDELAESTKVVVEQLSRVHTELVSAAPDDQGDDERVIYVPTLFVANKVDDPLSGLRLELLGESLGGRFGAPRVVSIEAGEGLDELRRGIYDLLGVFRVYTKVPGKPADRSRPYTLPFGSTVTDLARTIHRDLENSFKFARIWGSGVFEGQTVSRDHELRDADVVELHA